MKRFASADFSGSNPQLCVCSLAPGFPESRFVRLRAVATTIDMPLSLIAWEIFGSVRPNETAGRTNPAAPELIRGAVGPVTRAPTFGAAGPRIQGAAWFGIRNLRGFLPPEFDGLASFLNRAAEANVAISWPAFGQDATIQTGNLSRLIVDGVRLASKSPWIQIQFPHHRIRVTHYAVFFAAAPGCRSWDLSCSSDGENWTTVDSRTGLELRSSTTFTFALATPAECSFVRLHVPWTIIGVPFQMSAFEVFGSILN
jgi:hypothetical protein